MQTELPPHKPQDAEWSREMKGKKQLTSVGLANWVVVFPKKDQVPAKNLVSALQRVCPGLGMTVRVAIIGPVINFFEVYICILSGEIWAEVVFQGP